jgi:hypothetical protein
MPIEVLTEVRSVPFPTLIRKRELAPRPQDPIDVDHLRMQLEDGHKLTRHQDDFDQNLTMWQVACRE